MNIYENIDRCDFTSPGGKNGERYIEDSVQILGTSFGQYLLNHCGKLYDVF